MMLAPLLPALLLLQADAPGPPEIWYQQAMACGGALAATFPDRGQPDDETAKDMLLWAMIIADAAPKAGRTAEQVDGPDSDAAIAYFRRIKADKPQAHKAYLAYCRALSRNR